MSKKARYDCRQCGKALPLSVMMDGQKLNCSDCGQETNLLQALSWGPCRVAGKKNRVAAKTKINGSKQADYGNNGRPAGSPERLVNHYR